jgi:hypothetical protein
MRILVRVAGALAATGLTSRSPDRQALPSRRAGNRKGRIENMCDLGVQVGVVDSAAPVPNRFYGGLPVRPKQTRQPAKFTLRLVIKWTKTGGSSR